MMDLKVCSGSELLMAELVSRGLGSRPQPWVWRCRADQHSCCHFAEPMVEVNVLEANQKFMEHSEEVYDALMESRWQTADFSAQQDYLTSSLPEPIYC